jgi:hypothetical protein
MTGLSSSGRYGRVIAEDSHEAELALRLLAE